MERLSHEAVSNSANTAIESEEAGKDSVKHEEFEARQGKGSKARREFKARQGRGAFQS
jgi:hypothetical protein